MHWIFDVVVVGCFLFAGLAFIRVAAALPDNFRYLLRSGFVSLAMGIAIAWFFLVPHDNATPPAPTVGSAAAYREAQSALAQAKAEGSAAAYGAAHRAVEKATGKPCDYACKVKIADMSRQDAEAADRAAIDAFVGGVNVAPK